MTSKYSRSLYAVVCAAALICVLATAGWATTYYVSTTGNDTTGDGSKANPWKTMSRGDVLQVLAPGDTVVVAAGTYYHDNMQATMPGHEPVMTLINIPGVTYVAQGKVILDGSVAALNPTVLSVKLSPTSGSTLNANYTVLDGFEIVGGKTCLLLSGNTVNGLLKGVKVRNCIFRDNRTGNAPTTAYGGYLVSMNTTHDCEFTKNIVAITNPSDSGTLSGATRAISLATTGLWNKIYNNTICISGPTSALPNTVCGGITMASPTPFASDYISMHTKAIYYWDGAACVAYANPDTWYGATEPSDGDPNIDYRNVLINNIVRVNNPAGVGVYDHAPATGGDASWDHTVGLRHNNNVFSPAGGGVGGLYFGADFLQSSEPPACAINCPFPETSYAHNHVFKTGSNEFETNSMSFVNPLACDFTPAAGNPAIDAGVNIGLPYYGSAPDLGAIETMPAAYSAGSIADALAQSNGSVVTLTSAVVTVGNGTLLNNMIYVEEETRASGVAVQSSPMLTQVAEGQRVEVTGTLDKSGAQPVINALSIKLVAGAGGAFADDTPLRPVGTPNKSAVGVVGLDNTGLLATIWGEVTAVNSDYFCVDDGSGRDDGMGHAGVAVLISDQVMALATPTATYVAVTGVLGKKDLGGGVVAVIRPRVQADIR